MHTTILLLRVNIFDGAHGLVCRDALVYGHETVEGDVLESHSGGGLRRRLNLVQGGNRAKGWIQIALFRTQRVLAAKR